MRYVLILGLTVGLLMNAHCIRYGSDVKVYNETAERLCVTSTFDGAPGMDKFSHQEILAPKREFWLVNMMVGKHAISAYPIAPESPCPSSYQKKAQVSVNVKRNKIEIIKFQAADFK